MADLTVSVGRLTEIAREVEHKHDELDTREFLIWVVTQIAKEEALTSYYRQSKEDLLNSMAGDA